MSHPTDTKRIILGLLAPLCLAAACTGTPTPHPPDFLPSPNGGLINQIIPEVSTTMDPVTVPLAGDPGAVQGGTDVWVVNLDQATVPAVRVRARADGSFGPIDVVGSEGDRVRLVSRTAQRHS